jgi:hypothetical protein
MVKKIAISRSFKGAWTNGTNGTNGGQMGVHVKFHLYRHKLAGKRDKWARKS